MHRKCAKKVLEAGKGISNRILRYMSEYISVSTYSQVVFEVLGREIGSKRDWLFGHGSFRVRRGLRDARVHGGFAGGKIVPQRMGFHLIA
jgi:hypothetical protein